MILSILLTVVVFDKVTTKSFIDGTEKIPAYCQQYNADNDFADVSTALQLSYESELSSKADANQTGVYIRIGCPRNYKIFSEFHCIPVQYLDQYRQGAITWAQLQENRVYKNLLANLNRDKGRCQHYGPDHNPAVEFDDEHCIPFTSVCLYKFGKYEFDWVLPHREEYPPKPTAPVAHGYQSTSRVVLPSRRHCELIPSYVEYDETHCVAQSAVEGFVSGSMTWGQLLERKLHKFNFRSATTTTTTPRPPPARKQIELTVLKLVAPLIRPYVKYVANNKVFQEISFYDPPGMTERKNWKQFDGTAFSREGYSRLGLLRDLERRQVIPTNLPPCWTPQGKRGRCKMMKDCFQPQFYSSLDTFLDHSCFAGRGVVGVCCPAKASYNVSQRAFTTSEVKEWNDLIGSVEAEWKRSAPWTTTTMKPIKTLTKDERQVASWLQSVIRDWILPAESIELLIRIPDATKQEMKRLKNWRTFQPFLKLDKLGFGFGRVDWENILRPCEMYSGQPGVCKSASRCLQPELYRSRQVLIHSFCPRGTALGVCCREDPVVSVDSSEAIESIQTATLRTKSIFSNSTRVPLLLTGRRPL